MSIKNSKTILFADDTTVFCSSDNLAYLYHILNNELNVLADLFRANKLSLNTTKPNYILFSKHNMMIDTGIQKSYLNGDNKLDNKLD